MQRSIMTHNEFLERKKEYSRKYLAKQTYMAAWRTKNIKKIRAYEKRYREENKERIKEWGRVWTKKNWRKKIREDMKTPENRFKTSLRRARYLGREWNIQFSDYKEFITGRCFYCDGSLNEFGIGLDRLDNSKGYVIGNVAPCCGACNRMRGNTFTSEEMKVGMKAILELRKRNILSSIGG